MHYRGRKLATGPVIFDKVDAEPPELPPAKRRGRPPNRETYDQILKMQIGECFDVNRASPTVLTQILRFKARFDCHDRRFLVRSTGDRSCRVWRTA